MELKEEKNITRIGNKFIIEVDDMYFNEPDANTTDNPSVLYKIKGFKSLVFDTEGLKRLEKYSNISDSRYNEGLEKAQYAIKVLYKMTEGDRYRIFKYHDVDFIIFEYTIQDIISKVDNYLSGSFQVGEEIISHGLKGVIVQVLEDSVLFLSSYGDIVEMDMQSCHKTGVFYNEIINVVNSLVKSLNK